MPKFSIHIALYNCEKYIKQTLRALLDDPEPDLEILVCNDASRDHSAQIVKDAMADDPRIRLIDSKINRGIAGARALMLEETGAEYVIVLDHDDILLPLPRAQYQRLFEENPELSCIYGKKRHVDENLRDCGGFQGGTFSRFNIFWTNPVCHPGSILRRRAVLDAGGYMESRDAGHSLFCDMFLWLRMCLRGELLFANRYHLLYRRHAGQASQQQTKQTDLDVEHTYMESWLIREHKPLHEALLSGATCIPETNPRAIMLLLGLLNRHLDPLDPRQSRILDAAGRLDPNDYGVPIRKHTFYRLIHRADLALAECDLMIEHFEHNVYIRYLALKLKADLLLKLERRADAARLIPDLESLQSKLLDDIDWTKLCR